jgi:transcriptional regulator with XRE-family HTH domain
MENKKIIDDLWRVKSERGLSNKDFAELLGCSASYLSMVMNGKKGVGADLIYSLQKILGESSPSLPIPSHGQGVSCGGCNQIDDLDALILKSIAGFTPEQKRSIIEDIQKEKLLQELLKERSERGAA